jgi:hypothetical protein
MQCGRGEQALHIEMLCRGGTPWPPLVASATHVDGQVSNEALLDSRATPPNRVDSDRE